MGVVEQIVHTFGPSLFRTCQEWSVTMEQEGITPDEFVNNGKLNTLRSRSTQLGLLFRVALGKTFFTPHGELEIVPDGLWKKSHGSKKFAIRRKLTQ